jgi:hypothetical protein
MLLTVAMAGLLLQLTNLSSLRVKLAENPASCSNLSYLAVPVALLDSLHHRQVVQRYELDQLADLAAQLCQLLGIKAATCHLLLQANLRRTKQRQVI